MLHADEIISLAVLENKIKTIRLIVKLHPDSGKKSHPSVFLKFQTTSRIYMNMTLGQKVGLHTKNGKKKSDRK